MIRLARMVGVIASALVVGGAQDAWAVAPNPLENAYWRFEEGIPGNVVDPPNAEAVLDSSGNSNHMRAYLDTDPENPNPNASPTYTNFFVPPKPLKSGLPNTLAFEFDPVPNGKDVYSDGRQINNGIIASGGGFTIEAAFNSDNPATWGTIIAKEGRPELNNADPNLNSLPTFSLMTNADNSHLMVQQFDAARNLVVLESLQPLSAGFWYYAAVVNDGAELSLWLDSGFGYEWQGSVAVDGALYQGPIYGTDYNNNVKVDAADYVTWRATSSENQNQYDDWRADFGKGADWWNNWSIGRGIYGGIPSGDPANWFDGYIDEVRLSNVALAPEDFLFAPALEISPNAAPEPTGLLLAGLAIGVAALARKRRRFD